MNAARSTNTVRLRHGTEVGSKRVGKKNVASEGLNCPNSEASGKAGYFSSLGTIFHFDQLRIPKCRMCYN